MRCGAPVAAGRPVGAVMMARPVGAAPASRKGLIAAATAFLALGLGALAYFGFITPGSRVVEAPGVTSPGGPLTDRSGRINDAGPLTDKTGTITPAPGEPTEVIDYLKWLKQMERQRVTLERSLLSRALKLSTDMTAGPLIAEMSEKPEQGYTEVFSGFQQALSEMVTSYQNLSQQVFAKQPPRSCQELHNKYYDVLTKQTASLQQVSTSFSDAMGGNPTKALDVLTQMRGGGLGTPSHQVTDACIAADEALAAVCDKYRLRKDFDIKDETGGGSLIGR